MRFPPSSTCTSLGSFCIRFRPPVLSFIHILTGFFFCRYRRCHFHVYDTIISYSSVLYHSGISHFIYVLEFYFTAAYTPPQRHPVVLDNFMGKTSVITTGRRCARFFLCHNRKNAVAEGGYFGSSRACAGANELHH